MEVDRVPGSSIEHPPRGETLRIRVLGTLEAEGISVKELGSRKQRTLLRRLALDNNRPVSVDALCEALWPDSSGAPRNPAGQVSVLVSRLRALLGSARLSHSDAGYILHADWTDLSALGELAVEAERRLACNQLALASTAAFAGLALSRGPLLADDGEAQWALAPRVRAERDVSRLRGAAAQAALRLGNSVGAAQQAALALDENPFDEQALRLLMTAYVASSRPGLALAAYESSRRVLMTELGIDPAQQTQELHLAILRDEVPAESVLGRHPKTAVAATPELPGRRAAWLQLDAAYAAAATGIVVAMVNAGAGLGKTRLVREWVSEVSANGAIVHWGTCDPLAAVLPLQAPLDALHRYASAAADPYAPEILGSDASILAPLLGLVGVQPADVDPSFTQTILFTGLLSVFSRPNSLGTPVLVLEDLHHADSATLAWLGFLAGRSSGTSLLVIVTAQPQVATISSDFQIHLAPLDFAAVIEVVGASRAPALFERSGGHPLFLVELARVTQGELPASIRAAVEAQVAETGRAQVALKTAAILGGSVDLDLLAAVLNRPAVELLDDLESGTRRGLLREQESGFVFQHELVREALVAGSSATRRALVHRTAARHLASRGEGAPVLVASHARKGGDLVTASSALVRAAAIATDRFDHAQAEILLTDAIALHISAAAHLARARVRLTREDFGGAAADAATAAALLPGDAATAELAGWIAYYQRDFVTARGFAEAVEAVANEGDPMLVSALTLGGRIDHADGLLDRAGERLNRAVAGAGPTNGMAAVWLGWWQLDQGNIDETAALLLTTEKDPTLVGHPFGPAHRLLLSATTAAIQGRAWEALTLLDQVELEVDRRHLVHFAGRCLNYRAWLLRNLLATDEAHELNIAAGEAAAHSGLTEPAVQAALDLADAALRCGDLADADHELMRAKQLAGSGEGFAFAWRGELRHRLLTVRLVLADGRTEEAQHLAEQLHRDAESLGVRRYCVQAELLALQAAGSTRANLQGARIEELLGLLPSIAGLEAWSITTELAAAFDEPRWRSMARSRAHALTESSGPLADRFAAQAGARLDKMSTRRRKG